MATGDDLKGELGNYTGAPNRKFWEKDLKKILKKHEWSYFKHFGRLLGNIYLFLTASKTDGEVPSQQGAPSTCNPTHCEVSQQL